MNHPVVRSSLLALLLVAACDEAPQDPPVDGRTIGAPLAGLTTEQVARFRLGRDEFLEVEEENEGLGPLFNGRSCGECHHEPGLGGAGVVSAIRAGTLDELGVFAEPPGGSLIQTFSIRPDVARDRIPADANVVSTRIAPPLFGAGLIDAIPDLAIEAQAARTDRPPGVAGRAHQVASVSDGATRVGRFGVKAQRATLFDFAGDAYLNELGITNEIEPRENAPNGDVEALAQMDRVADPEAEVGAVGRLADFLRLLAPIERIDGVDVAAGAALFAQVGCDGCHLPSYRTGPHEVSALAEVEVELYSDLLLHDIGTGDGIAQAGAAPSEIRTPPLWGVRFRVRLLHDGTAIGVRAAIAAHRGEADGVIAAFDALSADEQAELLAFLGTL